MPLGVMPPPDHLAFCHEAPDGTLRAWDVSQALELVSDGREPMHFSLKDRNITPGVVRTLYDGIDEEYAMTTDLRRPLLFIPFSGECLLIDGWHRMFHAAVLGLDDVLMYLLTEREAEVIQWVEVLPVASNCWFPAGD